MPLLSYASITDYPFQPFTKIYSADVNGMFSLIQTLLNVTKLDSANIQAGGISFASIATGTPFAPLVFNSSGVVAANPVALTPGAVIVADANGQFTAGIAPGNPGNILESDGTNWFSAPSSSNQRNFLLNSNFRLWQRGTTGTIANSVSAYGPDRWYATNTLGAVGVVTLSQIAGSEGKFAAKVAVTTPPTTPVSTGVALFQTFENADTPDLAQQVASFACKIKAFGGVTQVGLQFMSNTTESKVVTAIGSEVLVAVNTIGNTLCSLNNQTLTLSPTSAGVFGVRIRVTAASGTLNNGDGFSVEKAVVNLGALSLPWSLRERSFASELAACQRFYEKSYDTDTVPGTVTNIGRIIVNAVVSTATFHSIYLKATKRGDGVSTMYSPVTGAAGNWADISSVLDRTAASVQDSQNSIAVSASATNAATANVTDTLAGHFTYEVEI